MAQRGRPRKNAVLGVEDPIAAEAAVEAAVATEVATPEADARPSTTNRARRPGRVPVNGYRNILSVKGLDPEFHYVWVGDDLVPRYEGADYEFTTHDVVVGDRRINAASQLGSKVSIPGGNGKTLFLMRIPKEWYEEDMAEFHAEIDRQEAALFAKLNSKEGGRYGEVTMNNVNPAVDARFRKISAR